MGRIACMFRNLGGFHAYFDHCTRLLFRRDGGRSWHRLRRDERRRRHQSHAHHLSGHGPVSGGGHRPVLGRAGQRRICLYLREEQKFGHSQWAYYDGQCAGLYRGGQLHRQYRPLGHHGELFRGNDLPAGCEVHPPAGDDHQGGHAERQRQEAGGAVGGVRRDRRLHLRLRRSRRRHDDAADPHLRAGV